MSNDQRSPSTPPEGLTPKQLADFLVMAEQATEREEHDRLVASIGGEELTPEDVDRIEAMEEHQHGTHRLLRWAVITFIAVLAMIAAGVAITGRGDGDDGVAPASTAATGTPTPAGPTPSTAGGAATTVTGDSVPTIPAELVGSWVADDGTFGYAFADDGSYSYASLDQSFDGRYRVAGDADDLRIEFVDESDPSGLTVELIAPVRFDGRDAIWLSLLGNDVHLTRGDLPEPGTATAPAATLDAAAANHVTGRLEVVLPAEQTTFGQPASQALAVGVVTGAVTIDAGSGSVDGAFTAAYTCSPDQCDLPGETATGTVTITVVDTRPSQYMQDTWAFEGTATLAVSLQATSDIAGRVEAWTWDEQLEGTYYVGLERTWAVFQVSVRLDDGNKVVDLQVSGPVTAV